MDTLTSVIENKDLPSLAILLNKANTEYLCNVCKLIMYHEWDEGLNYLLKHPSFDPTYDSEIWFDNCIGNSMRRDNVKYLRKILAHPKLHIELWKESILKEAIYYGYEKCTKFMLMLFSRDHKFSSEFLTSACRDLNEEVVRILVNDRRFPITKGAVRAAIESKNQTIINLLR